MASAKSRYTPRPPGPTPRPSSHTSFAARDAMSRGERLPNARILPLEIVVAIRLRDLIWRLGAIFLPFRHPHPAVVAQRFAHQRELRLVLAAHRDAGRVDLRVTRIGERRAALVRAPDRRDVRSLGVGREEEDVAVSARAKNDRVGEVRLDRAGDHVACDDAARPPVHDDDIEHLGAREHRHAALGDFLLERLIRTQQQLLAGLPAGVERPRHLCAAERTIGQQAAVLARERHALRDALVDDVHADLGETVHVRFARPKVAALDRVVEQPKDAVAVVLIVLGRVDAALGGDAVRPPRRVLEAEAADVVSELAQRRRGRRAGQPRSDDDDRVFPLVGGIHQLHLEARCRSHFRSSGPGGTFAFSSAMIGYSILALCRTGPPVIGSRRR